MAAPAPFLGVVEEETAKVVARRVLDVRVMSNFQADSVVVEDQSRTDIFKWLCVNTPCVISLYVTDTYLKNFLSDSDVKDMFVHSVVNMRNSRHGRTILQVSLGDSTVRSVLKCVAQSIAVKKSATEREVSTKTAAQQEVHAFDNLPDNLKMHFVEKIAHGRIWFRMQDPDSDISFETILMAMCLPSDVSMILFEMLLSYKEMVMRRWIEAIRLVILIHSHGYTHGDANLSNFVFTSPMLNADGMIAFARDRDMRKYDSLPLKMIDPERMHQMSEFDHVEDGIAYRNLYMMHDLNDILFRHLVFMYFNGHYTEVSVEHIQKRMEQIHGQLPVTLQRSFYLHDCMLFDGDILHMTADSSHVITFNELKVKHPQRCARLASGLLDVDGYLSLLTNPKYLHKTVTYVLRQIEKIHAGAGISVEDLTVPSIMADIPISQDPSAPPVQPVMPSGPSAPVPVRPAQNDLHVHGSGDAPLVVFHPPPGAVPSSGGRKISPQPVDSLPAFRGFRPENIPTPPVTPGIFPPQQVHLIPTPPQTPMPPAHFPVVHYAPTSIPTMPERTHIPIPQNAHVIPMPHPHNVMPVVHIPNPSVPITFTPLKFQDTFIVGLYLGHYCPLYFLKPNAFNVQVYVRSGGQYHPYRLPLDQITELIFSQSESQIIVRNLAFQGQKMYYKIEGVVCMTYVKNSSNIFVLHGSLQL
jgi:hypothetical protein